MAPADLVFDVLVFVLLALAELQLVQSRFQHVVGDRAVAVLRSVRLTLHYDSRRNVSNSHGAVGFVDVLTACARGSVGIDSQIAFIDFDLDRVVHNRVNPNGCETCVAPSVGIEWRDSHQPMNTRFAL